MENRGCKKVKEASGNVTVPVSIACTGLQCKVNFLWQVTVGQSGKAVEAQNTVASAPSEADTKREQRGASVCRSVSTSSRGKQFWFLTSKRSLKDEMPPLNAHSKEELEKAWCEISGAREGNREGSLLLQPGKESGHPGSHGRPSAQS